VDQAVVMFILGVAHMVASARPEDLAA